MATVDESVRANIKQAIEICKESPFYHTLCKEHRKEAVIHTYRLLQTMKGEAGHSA